MNEKDILEELEDYECDSFSPDSEYKKDISGCIAELKALCNRARLPMFLSIAVNNTQSGTQYINECILASVSDYNKGERISKLLLACNDAKIDYPPHIQKAIQDLSEYLSQLNRENKSDTVVDISLTEDKISDFVSIGEGLLEVGVAPELLRQSEDVFADLD